MKSSYVQGSMTPSHCSRLLSHGHFGELVGSVDYSRFPFWELVGSVDYSRFRLGITRFSRLRRLMIILILGKIGLVE